MAKLQIVIPERSIWSDYVDKPTTMQLGGVGLGYVRLQAKGKQDRRRVTGKTDT